MNSLVIRSRSAGSLVILLLIQLWTLDLGLWTASATVVFGNLSDISIQALNTKLMFAPTNEVLVAQSGLSAGPPKIIATVHGAFSLPLEPGDYTVSLPLITWRHPFCISVFDSASPVNITNLLCFPRTYTYTNPFVPPLHVNTTSVTAWSTNGEVSLLDGSATVPGGSLVAGRTITIEAFGSLSDPAGNAPTTTFKIKLGSTVIATESEGTADAHWHLRALVTIRTSGATGTVAATEAISIDNPAVGILPCDTTFATLDLTVPLTVDLTGTIQDFTGAEAIHCDQLVIHLD